MGPESVRLKACDGCKARKVRCTGSPGPCTQCQRRKEKCHFSRVKLPRRPKVDTELLQAVQGGPAEPSPVRTPALAPGGRANKVTLLQQAMRYQLTGDKLPHLPQIPELHVDRLLTLRYQAHNLKDDRRFGFTKLNGLFGGNYSLSFFSESRLLSISQRLQNSKVNELVQKISIVVSGRVKPGDAVSAGTLSRELFQDSSAAAVWIKLYFQRVHPLYPFLDQTSFEAMTQSPGMPSMLQRDKVWAALYHSVLALGCQYDGGGSFEPGKGRAWRLFSTSLALFPDLLTLPHSLALLQAMTSMAVYAFGLSCVSIEHVIISEAARRAQSLSLVNLTGTALETYHRNFWVLYSMEKVSSFWFGRTSECKAFVDSDISCHVPSVPLSFLDFDWFLTFVRHSRLISRALTSIFCVGVTGSPGSYYLSTLEQLSMELEQWRQMIPEAIRPRESIPPHALQQLSVRPVALWTHYMYYTLRLALARAMLHLSNHTEHSGLVSEAQQMESKTLIMNTSRSILELTTCIDVEPCTPLWVLAGVPVMALFVLFDLVIHNPTHQETRNNLALLDVAGGYFSRIQYASGGTLPGSLITDFAYIAREHANNALRGAEGTAQSSIPPTWQPKSVPAATPIPQSQEQTRTFDTNGDAGMSISTVDVSTNGGSLVDALSFPATELLYEIHDGTDVMDLFNYFVPGIDPMFWQGDYGEAVGF